MEKKSYEEYIEWMKAQSEAHCGDIEGIHRSADYILLEFLRELGYEKLAEAFENLPKRYA